MQRKVSQLMTWPIQGALEAENGSRLKQTRSIADLGRGHQILDGNTW